MFQKGYTCMQSTPTTRTLATDSNLMLTRSNTYFCFSSDHFYIILPSITRFKRVTSKKNRLTVMIRFSARGAYLLSLVPQGGRLFGTGRLFLFFEKQRSVQKKF